MEIKSKQLIIETTNLCDAHCVTCPREQFTQNPQSMAMDLFKKIVDDASQYEINVVDTCGYGEVFLDKEIFNRYAYIKKMLPKAQIFCSTTGFHMTSDKWDSVLQYVDTVKFSIYGTSRETYEAFHRGNLKFDQTMENVLWFMENARWKSRKPHTIGLFLCTDENKSEMDAWLYQWEPVFDEVLVWKPHNWIDGRSYRILDRTRQRSCGRPENATVYIHADGMASPCCFDIHKRIPLGDMKVQTLAEIYKGDPYRKLRDAHANLNFEDYICKDCDQTNHNPDVLVYANNPEREVGQMISNIQKIYREGQNEDRPEPKRQVQHIQ